MLLEVFHLAMYEKFKVLLSGGFYVAAFCEVLWPLNRFDWAQVKQRKLNNEVQR